MSDINTAKEALEAKREKIRSAVEKVWPAPSFRKHQKEATVEILERLYVHDSDVVTLSAPTGAGKSLIIYAVSRVISDRNNAQSFITTPLNSLIDQIKEDEYINKITTLKGKNNYTCIHPRDLGAPVDEAICQLEDDFKCQYKHMEDTNGGCSYYGRRTRAQDTDIAVTNLSYLMTNSMIPESEDARFEPRNFLACDETQNIESFALNFIGFTIKESNIPVNFNNIPEMPAPDCPMSRMVNWLRSLLSHIIDKLLTLNSLDNLTAQESKDQDTLERLKHKIANFLEDYDNGEHWTKTRNQGEVKFEPIFVGRFIDDYLWNQADKILLSSATIPKGNFLEAVGLADKEIAHVEVPSTFPTERRPVITREMVGKMTKSDRDQTIPKLATKLTKIANHHSDERGFVHCKSYNIMQRIYDHLSKDMRQRTMKQNPHERMESLEDWYQSDTQIFLSVSMDEGISLDDDKARWQVVAKASYPFMGDERVNYRVNEMDDWEWYSGQAIIDLQQAVGRGMRSKDDYCITYLLDSSFRTLINRNEHLFEQWFLNSIDCQTPLDVYSSSTTNFTFSS